MWLIFLLLFTISSYAGDQIMEQIEYQKVDDCPYPSQAVRTESGGVIMVADTRCQDWKSEGCLVARVEGIERVINPGECKDKKFVSYLNCWDQLFKPQEIRPKECQG